MTHDEAIDRVRALLISRNIRGEQYRQEADQFREILADHEQKGSRGITKELIANTVRTCEARAERFFADCEALTMLLEGHE